MKINSEANIVDFKTKENYFLFRTLPEYLTFNPSIVSGKLSGSPKKRKWPSSLDNEEPKKEKKESDKQK